jgi:Cu2+-containing amine oxidase
LRHISSANNKEDLEECNRRIVYVKYLDHLLFRDSESKQYEPPIIEAVGWIDKETKDWIRIICEQHSKIPNANPNTETGFIILRGCILDMKTLRC